MGVVAFWAVLGVVGVGIIVAAVLARLARERTIREAIGKGLVTDSQSLHQLIGARDMPWSQRLVVLGLIVTFVAVGLGVFAIALGRQEPESLAVLLGIAAAVLMLGAGLLSAGFWLRRARNDQS